MMNSIHSFFLVLKGSELFVIFKNPLSLYPLMNGLQRILSH